MSARLLAIATALGAFYVPIASRADPVFSEALVAGASMQSMDGADGGSVSADLVRATERRVLSTGAQVSNVGPSRWTVFRATLTQARAERASVAGSIEAGPGSTAGVPFTYAKLGMRVSVPLTDRWALVAEDVYVDVDSVVGNVLTLGGESARPSGTLFRLQGSRSTAGTLDEQSFLFRFDYRAAAPFLMAGLTASRTNNRLALGAQAHAPTTRTRQAFFGLSVPVRSKELTVTFDLGDVGGLRRSGLSVYVRSPLAPIE